jgi:hypothetical protein
MIPKRIGIPAAGTCAVLTLTLPNNNQAQKENEQ